MNPAQLPAEDLLPLRQAAHAVAALLPGGMVLESESRDPVSLRPFRSGAHAERVELAALVGKRLEGLELPHGARAEWDGSVQAFARLRATTADHRPVYIIAAMVVTVALGGRTLSVALPLE